MATTLVLLRHGQSVWNLENIFTGWTDVALSPQGMEEAAAAGRLMAEAGYQLDVAHTSVLVRAIDTLHRALYEMGMTWIPVKKDWRLNERHYGALQGLNKKETADRHSPEQVHIWRRSYDTPPPALSWDDPRHPHSDPRYAWMPPNCRRRPSVSRTSSTGCCRTGTTPSFPTCAQEDGDRCGSRQQSARSGQTSRRDLR